jgi:adenine-specific DNA-methyltransferase
MADELDGLLARVDDPDLRADLRAQIDRIRAKRTFGLVFESHLPERVRLPEHPIRAGASVALRDDSASATYQVLAVRQGAATVRRIRDAHGSRLSDEELASLGDEEQALEDLVVVADFGQPVYPGIRTLGSVDRGGDKPAHVVIKGENHHVLEALQFTHAGKVDCIYIDPPYNTGARDWKYDNRYVDDTDAYRHSKWLAFMERRLLLAKELLNPEESILVVAIDENERSRLDLLLEQTFPGAGRQLVTSVINRTGSPRPGRLTRVEEYLSFVFVGAAKVAPWSTNLLTEEQAEGEAPPMPTVWFSAHRRGGRKALRSYYADTTLFYPVLIDKESGAFRSIGPSLHTGESPSDYVPPDGTLPIWPISHGREQTWRFTREKMAEAFESGTARLGRRDPTTGLRPVTYLQPGTLKAIENGVFRVTGRTAEGALELELADTSPRAKAPATVWNLKSHYARDHGSKLLTRLIPGREFPFPKSLYAVEDTLRVAVGRKPHAIVVDFFGGSGTTTHAVARLNRQDGGSRQSIVVTNNEVSAAEADALRQQGFRPGDPEWEAMGIFEHVTRPRITSAISGVTPDGKPVKGGYKFTDEFPMAEGFEENVAFAELVYLDPDDVELGLAFAAVAPLLWLRAGALGPIIEECLDSAGRRKPYAWTERYGVLFNPDRWRSFVEKLPASATTAFVVTDSQAIFAGVTAELPDHLEVVRLYENYLTTFRINEGLG